MGSPDTSDEAAEALNEKREEAIAKVATFGKVIGTALEDMFADDEQRLAALISYASGFAKGVGKTKEDFLKWASDMFDAATAFDKKATTENDS